LPGEGLDPWLAASMRLVDPEAARRRYGYRLSPVKRLEQIAIALVHPNTNLITSGSAGTWK
jgi:hypothetical protein